MEQIAGKRAFDIYLTIMTDDRYRSVSEVFWQRLVHLQKMIPSFSPEQWKAVNEYLEISDKVNQIMVEIASEDNPR